MLLTETNNQKTDRLVMRAARNDREVSRHKGLRSHFEHGQWWVTCGPCGASWSVVDQEGLCAFPVGFERIDDGDGYCMGDE